MHVHACVSEYIAAGKDMTCNSVERKAVTQMCFVFSSECGLTYTFNEYVNDGYSI